LDTLPPEPEAPVASPDALAPHPAAPQPLRKSALAFVALVLPSYALLGSAAQGANPALGLLVSELVLLAGSAALAALGSGLSARDGLLLARRPRQAQVALAALIGLAGFFAAGALMSLTSLLLPARWVEHFDLGRAILDLPPQQRLGVWVAAVLVAPVCEELTFRGWVLTALRTRHHPGRALFLSGLLFALVHLDPVRFTAVLALGTLFAWLAWRAGSVWPAVVAHVANNALGVALGASGAGESDLPVARAHGAQMALWAVLVLAVSGAAVRALTLAYRRATPEPPPVEAALVARPGDAPGPFRWSRVPRAALLAFLVGIFALCAIAGTGKR
jgi:membrane protease YdiL (CAAX protease family)